MPDQKPAATVSAAGPEPLTTRLARLGSRMREDENKVLIAEAVEALHAAEEAPSETWVERYYRNVLVFVGARGDIDLETVSISSGYEAPYQYSEYTGGGGHFAVNVSWKETSPREDETTGDADWDGLYPHYVELQNEDVTRFLNSLG